MREKAVHHWQQRAPAINRDCSAELPVNNPFISQEPAWKRRNHSPKPFELSSVEQDVARFFNCLGHSCRSVSCSELHCFHPLAIPNKSIYTSTCIPGRNHRCRKDNSPSVASAFRPSKPQSLLHQSNCPSRSFNGRDDGTLLAVVTEEVQGFVRRQRKIGRLKICPSPRVWAELRVTIDLLDKHIWRTYDFCDFLRPFRTDLCIGYGKRNGFKGMKV